MGGWGYGRNDTGDWSCRGCGSADMEHKCPNPPCPVCGERIQTTDCHALRDGHWKCLTVSAPYWKRRKGKRPIPVPYAEGKKLDDG